RQAARVGTRHRVIELGVGLHLVEETPPELGDLRAEEYEPGHGPAGRYERDREARERMTDQDQVARGGDRAVDDLGVALIPGGLVLAREVHGEDPMSPRLEDR